MIGPRLRRVAALAATLAAAGTVMVACGGEEEEHSSIDYLTDARVASYNANTPDGYANGSLMALTRVLPGFSFIGPDGQIVADRDIGSATLQEDSPQTVEYAFNPAAVYSDGHKMTCDDLLLAATALGGEHRQFDAASNAGYQDIKTVDCAPGSRTATVTFERGKTYENWRGLFGAGTLLPAHVVGRLAGVSNVGNAIRTNDRAAIAKIAKAWNTGFAMKPGEAIDPKVFVSAGPYRIRDFTAEKGLRLVSNDKWWGQEPTLGDATIWTRGTDGDTALKDGVVDVVDSDDLAAADKVAGRESPAPGADRGAARDPASLSVTSLVFSRKGAVSDLKVRQALASCMPRNELARAHGANGVVWSMRSVAPADSLGPSLNVQYGRRYPRSDLGRARNLLEDRENTDRKPMVRIGYPAGSEADAAVVKTIADTCARAGVSVRDVSTPDFSVTSLGKKADAVLMAGDTFAAAGTASGFPSAYSLSAGDPLNLSDFPNRSVREAIADLASSSRDSGRLPLLRTIDTAAWDELPTIPLYGTVRGREASGAVTHAVPGLGRSGTGWNMDRWGGTA
ncbi:ABC transporter substrate-binding protein [Gordonia zhaorongruii]|uniref:ABC transporter substrate-binding protein n=1 Tax=Gordonia zhaorongruii TaxID=2597659 RepID=UPI0010522E0C|nr:ABC transporter substrate-binding protein [Gordonia zhaorongruii]